jgi:hypothetical protein
MPFLKKMESFPGKIKKIFIMKIGSYSKDGSSYELGKQLFELFLPAWVYLRGKSLNEMVSLIELRNSGLSN